MPVARVLGPPDLLHQLSRREHPVPVASKKAQQAKLRGAQLHRPPGHRHLRRPEVDIQTVRLKQRRRPRLRARRPPQHRPQPRQQLIHVERLRQVIVRARLQRTRNAIVVLRQDHRNHRRVAGRAHAPQHGQRIHVRQPQVQQHHVRLLGRAQVQASGARASDDRRAVAQLQVRTQLAHVPQVVFDHQHQRAVRTARHPTAPRLRATHSSSAHAWCVTSTQPALAIDSSRGPALRLRRPA